MGAGPIGVGLVGYGLAGSGLHAPLIGAEPRLRLHAVASRHPEKVHGDLPAARVVATPAALLEDPAVELVVVAAPTTSTTGSPGRRCAPAGTWWSTSRS
jgi:predicted dehydrogenase